MPLTKNLTLLFLGSAFVVGAAWLLTRRRQAEIGGLRTWQGTLTERYGVQKAQELAAAVRRQHAALAATTVLPGNQALRWHLQANILPGLALYRALLQEHAGNQPAALADVDAAFRAWTLAGNRLLLAPLKLLPAPFKVFKPAMKLMMRKFPVQGWDFTYIEDSDERVAFNGTRCFYLQTLTSLGAPELTASFCKTDDVMAELFPASIRFVRTKTLGRGDEICNFQYCRAHQRRN